MPTIHEPSPSRVRGGPGTVPGTTSTNRRRRRRKFPTTSVASLDDLDFELENVAPPTNSSIVVKEILSPKPKSSGRKKQKARNFLPSTTTPSPYNPTFPPIPSQRSIPQQQTAPTTTTLSHVRHTLLVDTRTLDTCQGVVIGASVLNQTRAFLSSMRCRGIAPYLLGCLHSSGQNLPRSRPPMAVKTLRVLGNSRLTVSVDCFCEPLLIHPSVNSGNIRNTQAVKVPIRLLANASWKIFGDLVEEATVQDQKSPVAARKVPLNVTLLTNDVALLCDGNIEGAHKSAITFFWNRIRPLFHNNCLRSIELVVVNTGTIQVQKTKASSHMDVEASAQETEQGREAAQIQDSMPNEEAVPTNAASEQARSRVARCVQQIRQHLVELADADYKADRNREEAVTPVLLSVMLLENTHRDFGVLGRRWLSQVMSPPDLKGSITFELPETMDGTQCSISLDVKYRALPYPADAPAAAGMLADLQLLSSSSLEVVQLVPVSCVDANLLFGVSMEVLPGFQNDEDRFKEMKALVHVLFKQLRDKDAALLLQAKGPDRDEVSAFGPPLHHTCNQTYLLMAQDLGSLSQAQGAAPTPFEASLFRYVNAEQMLSVGSADLYVPEVGDDILEQFNEYVECSFELLQNSLINPLFNDELRILREMERMAISETSANTAKPKKMEVDGEWSDKSGIGSMVKPGAARTNENRAAEPTKVEEDEWHDKSGIGATRGLGSSSKDSSGGINKATPTATTKQKKSKVALSAKSKKEEEWHDAVASVNPSQDSVHEISEAVTTLTGLMQRRKFAGPSKKVNTKEAKTRIDISGVFGSQDSLDDISEAPGSQDSLDDISEPAPRTPKEKTTLDQLTQTQKSALGQLLCSDEDSDDDWKGYKGVGYLEQSNAKASGSADNNNTTPSTKAEGESSDSSSEDEIFVHKSRKSSEKATHMVKTFLEGLTDTDSDPEFA